MIEIKCTQAEKEVLICCLGNPDNFCFFPKSIEECRSYVSCSECLGKNIKWIITDGGKYMSKLVINRVCPYCGKDCNIDYDEHTVTKRKTKQFFHKKCYEANTRKNKEL